MSYTNDTLVTSTYANDSEVAAGFLLKEDFFHLLLENGSRIVLSFGTDYVNDSL